MPSPLPSQLQPPVNPPKSRSIKSWPVPRTGLSTPLYLSQPVPSVKVSKKSYLQRVLAPTYLLTTSPQCVLPGSPRLSESFGPNASQLPSGRAPFRCKRPALTQLPIFPALTPPLCFPVILPASIVIHLMCLRLLITHLFRLPLITTLFP